MSGVTARRPRTIWLTRWNAYAEPLGQLDLGHAIRLQELFGQDLTWVGRDAVGWEARHGREWQSVISSSAGPSVVPSETNPVLIVDANAVLPLPVTRECLEAVGWRGSEVKRGRLRHSAGPATIGLLATR